MTGETRKYYEAYEERYQTAHRKGVSWAGDQSSPIVLETLRKYRVPLDAALLEIGCGEGRDARAVLEAGYDLQATDVSPEAIAYCQSRMPRFRECFSVLDCLEDRLEKTYDFIYAVAVVHMLVPDEDRKRFYQFVARQLKPQGLALICTMGDGQREMQSDVRRAFEMTPRNHPSGVLEVATTSCRMVSFDTFERELTANGLKILEKGLTASPPEFDSLLYAVAAKEGHQTSHYI